MNIDELEQFHHVAVKGYCIRKPTKFRRSAKLPIRWGGRAGVLVTKDAHVLPPSAAGMQNAHQLVEIIISESEGPVKDALDGVLPATGDG